MHFQPMINKAQFLINPANIVSILYDLTSVDGKLRKKCNFLIFFCISTNNIVFIYLIFFADSLSSSTLICPVNTKYIQKLTVLNLTHIVSFISILGKTPGTYPGLCLRRGALYFFFFPRRV